MEHLKEPSPGSRPRKNFDDLKELLRNQYQQIEQEFSIREAKSQGQQQLARDQLRDQSTFPRNPNLNPNAKVSSQPRDDLTDSVPNVKTKSHKLRSLNSAQRPSTSINAEKSGTESCDNDNLTQQSPSTDSATNPRVILPVVSASDDSPHKVAIKSALDGRSANSSDSLNDSSSAKQNKGDHIDNAINPVGLAKTNSGTTPLTDSATDDDHISNSLITQLSTHEQPQPSTLQPSDALTPPQQPLAISVTRRRFLTLAGPKSKIMAGFLAAIFIIGGLVALYYLMCDFLIRRYVSKFHR